MRNYQYPTTTGHTVVSPANLTYALDGRLRVDFAKVLPADLKRVSVLPNLALADVVTALTDGSAWISGDAAVDSRVPIQPSIKNLTLIKNGVIYIRDGREYVPLEAFLSASTHESLKRAFEALVLQTAVCQSALAESEHAAAEQAV